MVQSEKKGQEKKLLEPPFVKGGVESSKFSQIGEDVIVVLIIRERLLR